MTDMDPMKEGAVALATESVWRYHRLTIHYYDDGEHEDVTACERRVNVIRDDLGTREEMEDDGRVPCSDCYGGEDA